jgi:ribosome recycling factor
MTIHEIIIKRQEEFNRVVDHLKGELAGLRTGRASTALVEGIQVEAYGTAQSLRDMAQISIPEPRQIYIQPWDKSVMPAMEKAIQLSPLGVNPVNDGNGLRVILPPLTEDRRRELTKVVGQHAEAARVAVRNVREAVMKDLKRQKDEGGISEDEQFRGEEHLQKKVDEINKVIKELATAKETEIMTV